MYMDRTHPASQFIRTGNIAERVNALLFTDHNPLKRPLIEEYLRFYRKGVFDEDVTVDFDDLLSKRSTSISRISQIVNVEDFVVENALIAALNVQTATKTFFRDPPFDSLPAGLQQDLCTKLDAIESDARE
jgi:hypothetical protein